MPAQGQRLQFTQGSVGGSATRNQPAPSTPLNNPPPQSNFDPYATSPSPGASSVAPSLGSPGGMSYGAPAPVPSGGGIGSPLVPPPPNSYGQPYPGMQPPVLFPNGIQTPGMPTVAPPAWANPAPGPYLKLFQNIRFQYTWLAGDQDSVDLDINDIEVGATMAFPNFLFSGQPIFVSPGFVFHVWDGPRGPSPADLPSQAYSAFVDLGWRPQSRFTPNLSAELGLRFGVHSDFEHITADSVRYQGTGLGVIRLTPALTMKAGIVYLDRADIKLLPAGGFYYEPDQYTKFDIFFPRPKLARYFTTIGLTDVWWYVGGEYGGGNWTIERPTNPSDRVDINDIRVFVGLEWTHPNQLQGFFEAGYVFEREIVYVVRPQDSVDLNDTFMLRAGLAW